jgi:hypothetical protein
MEDARDPNDSYETAPEAVHMLLSNLRLCGGIWEPSCGRGAIVRELLDAGIDKRSIAASDKYLGLGMQFPELYSVLPFEADFLSVEVQPPRTTNIVMNPPFSAADEHVRHALRIVPSGGVVCVLLRMTWIAAKKRADLLPFLKRIIICGRLKMLPPDVPDKGHNGAVDFAWFVFAPLAVSATTIVRSR